MNRKTPVVIGVVILTPIVLIIGVYLSVRHRNEVFAKNAHAAYQTQIRALGAEGVQTAMEQLQDPLPPPALDAGPIYKQIGARVKAHPLSPDDAVVTNGFPSGHLPTPAQWTTMHAAIQHQAPLLALIHKAVVCPKCDLRIDWTNPNPAAVLFPDFATIRMSARALSVESLDLAHQGRMREAVQNQALGFRLADHASGGRLMIATLVNVAINAITLEGMRKILYLSHGDPATAQAVADAIHNNLHIPRFSDALKNEIAFEVSELEYLRKAGPSSLADIASQDSSNARPKAALRFIPQSQWSAYIDDNGALVLATLRRNRALVDLPYPVSHPRLIASDKTLEQELSQSGGIRYMVTAILTSEQTAFASKRSYIQATAESVETSARLLAEKSESHAFPANADVFPNIPTDPFTGKPLKYRREGAGFVLYSVGEDGTFDGGSPSVRPKKFPSLFRYPMPAYYTEPAKEF